MASSVSAAPRGSRAPLRWARAADEFTLTTVMLFGVVTVVRWLRDPESALYIGDLDAALAVVGAISGATITALMLTGPGRRSGGHLNPAVTVALWLMGVFPGRSVTPYVLAQLAGSVTGTALGRLVWGPAVSVPQVAYVAIRPSPAWAPASVFLAETGGVMALMLVAGLVMSRPSHVRLLPYVIGVSVGVVIAVLGPRSGGSINPARQFGPAAFAWQTTDLWIYMFAPILGAVLGAAVHGLLVRRLDSRRSLNEGVPPCEST